MPSRVSVVVNRGRRTDRKCALVPVATLVVGQIARRELAGMVHVLVRVSVLLRAVGVGMAVVGVRVRCGSGRRAAKIERRDGLSHCERRAGESGGMRAQPCRSAKGSRMRGCECSTRVGSRRARHGREERRGKT